MWDTTQTLRKKIRLYVYHNIEVGGSLFKVPREGVCLFVCLFVCC